VDIKNLTKFGRKRKGKAISSSLSNRRNSAEFSVNANNLDTLSLEEALVITGALESESSFVGVE
jgi:hypothetical protein